MTRRPVSVALAGPRKDGLAAFDSLFTIDQDALQIPEGGCYLVENDSYCNAIINFSRFFNILT